MRALIIHDVEGRVLGAVTYPDDAPPAHPAGGPGELFSEVEISELGFDASKPEGAEQLLKEVARFRVETGGEAKLVPKRGEKKGRSARP